MGREAAQLLTGAQETQALAIAPSTGKDPTQAFTELSAEAPYMQTNGLKSICWLPGDGGRGNRHGVSFWVTGMLWN